MVKSGLKREVLHRLGLQVFCYVHEEETQRLAEQEQITRSAAGIRRAFEIFGNEVLLSIGDAPTALFEAIRLIEQEGWQPHLLIGLPVGFIGTEASKAKLRELKTVPYITNRGTRGGSPWGATCLNALMIEVLENQQSSSIAKTRIEATV